VLHSTWAAVLVIIVFVPFSIVGGGETKPWFPSLMPAAGWSFPGVCADRGTRGLLTQHGTRVTEYQNRAKCLSGAKANSLAISNKKPDRSPASGSSFPPLPQREKKTAGNLLRGCVFPFFAGGFIFVGMNPDGLSQEGVAEIVEKGISDVHKVGGWWWWDVRRGEFCGAAQI